MPVHITAGDAGSVGQFIMMRGNERLIKDNVAFTAATSILSNVALVSLAGAISAAIAMAICLLSMNIELGIWTIPLVIGERRN